MKFIKLTVADPISNPDQPYYLLINTTAIGAVTTCSSEDTAIVMTCGHVFNVTETVIEIMNMMGDIRTDITIEQVEK